MNHDQDYPPEYLSGILSQVQTIAMVGASPDPTKFSYGVLRVLQETGYDMIPVNPNQTGTEIRGLRVYESLAAIGRPVDMVQVFRNSEALLRIAQQAMIGFQQNVIVHSCGIRSPWSVRRLKGKVEPRVVEQLLLGIKA